MWDIFLLAMSLGVYFKSGGVYLDDEGFVEG